jgi:hypothetical protein
MMRGVVAWPKCAGRSVDTVDTFDTRFKSLYPFCLFFKQVGFSFVHLNSPHSPQTLKALYLWGAPRGSRPFKNAIHPMTTRPTKPLWRENPTKTYGYYLVR